MTTEPAAPERPAQNRADLSGAPLPWAALARVYEAVAGVYDSIAGASGASPAPGAIDETPSGPASDPLTPRPPITNSAHVWVSQGEDGVSTDCARCGIWCGKTYEGHQCQGAPQTEDGKRRAARAVRIKAATEAARTTTVELARHAAATLRNAGTPPAGRDTHLLALDDEVTRLTELLNAQDPAEQGAHPPHTAPRRRTQP